ncbi:extracellular solute-binding protein [Streptomyces sp. B6B3]|uniref:extracellular solute-binding protein n=1 Tax=Streptomyces sp. B6B3 TaxID=3153570 RepID=UPI00325C5634
MTWDHPRGVGCLLAAGEVWRRVRPDVEVTWQTRSLQAFADFPLEELVARYDVVVIDHPHVPHAHDHGLLLPLDGRGHDARLAALAARSVGASYPSYEHGGHQYGLPVDAAAQVAAYRHDLLPRPPRTWEECLELAADGRVLWPAKPVDAISSFLTLAANQGHPVAAGPDRFVAPEAGLAVLDQLHRLADSVPPACLSENPIETAERLSTSDTWAYAPLLFGYTNYSRSGFRPRPLTYTDIPEGPGGVAGSCLGGAGIAVSARTAHPDEAAEYALWLASDSVQRGSYFAGGGQPANAAAWEDEAVNADCRGFFRNTRRTLEQSWLRPRYAGWLAVQDAAGTAINAALRRRIDDDECLRRMERSYARSLEAATDTDTDADADTGADTGAATDAGPTEG